jgi:phosphatidylglycerol:prolipoprotein diacylglycerol transferase
MLPDAFSPLLAYYLHDLSPFVVRFTEGFGLRWYGLGYLAGFVAAFLLVKGMAKKGVCAVPENQVSEFIFWACLLGVFVGGRVGSMLLYDFGNFLQNPLIVFKVWEGGMASHGGIAGLMIYLFWYSHRHNISWLGVGDMICATAPVGIFCVRCANFINGELYGRPANVPWAVQFPAELLDNQELATRVFAKLQVFPATIHEMYGVLHQYIEQARTDPAAQEFLRGILTPRHPSQFYEAGLEGALLFAILFPLARSGKAPQGLVSGLFFVLYAIFRIVVEGFREPDASLIGPLTRGQFYSVFMIAIGLGFIVFALKRGRIAETWVPGGKEKPSR